MAWRLWRRTSTEGKREGNDLTREEVEDYVAEGVEAAVPYRGKAREVLNQLVGGFSLA